MQPAVSVRLNALQALNHWVPAVWLEIDPCAYPAPVIAHAIDIALWSIISWLAAPVGARRAAQRTTNRIDLRAEWVSTAH